MKPILRLPLAVALALGNGHALALGLGQIEVKSGLYQPLEAEIPVLSTLPGETEQLTVQLASPEDFQRVGLDRPAILAAQLQFTVTRTGAQPVIHVLSKDKITEPFLSFMLEVNWGKGRLLREFTVLLDPPLMAPATGQAATAAAPEVPAAPAEELPDTVAEPSAEAAATAESAIPESAPASAVTPDAAPEVSSYSANGGEYGPVSQGQTLWAIANGTRPDSGVSVNQMMIAFLTTNPDAFIDGNINRLKQGAILRVPSREQALAISSREAASWVREQADAWRDRRGEQPQPLETVNAGVASPAADKDGRSTPSHLELVPPGDKKEGAGALSGTDTSGAEGSELRSELARAREDIAARDQEITELRSQLEEVEHTNAERQRMIELQNSELAALNQRLQAAQAAGAAAADANTPAPAPESAPNGAGTADTDSTSSPAVTPPAATGDTSAAQNPEATAASSAESPAVAATPPPDSQATAPTPAPSQPTKPAKPVAPSENAAPWYLNLWVLGGAGLAAMGVLVLLLARRSGRQPAASQGSNSSELAASFPVSKSIAAVAAGDLDNDGEVDSSPITDERENALLKAVAERPADLSRHLELARYYHEQGNADRFEGVTEAMHAQVYDPGNLLWKKVVAMGQELLPDHPLFAAASSTQPSETAEDDTSWVAAATQTPSFVHTATPSKAEDYADTVAMAEPEQDFSLEEYPPLPAMDFEPAAVPSMALDADTPESHGSYASVPDEDAATTKLELARAYLDMGDIDGARGMLEEVAAEGNADQRAEAKRLLGEIRS